MMGGVKEDEKNEKIIRGLLKLPANRHCINCNSPGPLYVCTNFWTFVCSICSGIHREFTHRVKSVSMAKFTSEEVCSLQRGGNERAKQIYFKEWDPIRQSLPCNSNVDVLRKFIKHVYVDRRYTGEKAVDGPRKVEREDSYSHCNGPHRLPNLDIFQQRCIERSGSSGRGDERGNSGHDKESLKHDDRRRISAYFEGEDERFQDQISETTRSEANWYSNRLHNLDRRPSNRYKALDSSKPREVRPLREILERIPTMRLNAALKEDYGGDSNSSVHMQRSASTISRPRQVDGNSMEPRRLNSLGHERKTLGSPANISSDREPASRAQQSPKSTSQSIPKQVNLSLVRIDRPPEGNQSKTASTSKNLDSVVPAKAMGGVLNAEIPNMCRMPSIRGLSPAAPLRNVLTSSPASSSPTPKASHVSAAFLLNTSEANHVKQEQGIPQAPCLRFPNTAIQSTSYIPSGSPNLQSQHIPQGHGTGPVWHSGLSDQNSSGKKELPQHLFAATCSSAPVPSAGCQPVEAHGMGYCLQYSAPVQVPTIYQKAKSTNNFDINNVTHIQSPMLSSMDSNSLGSPSTQWMPAQSSAYGAMPFHPLSSTSGMPLSSHTGQQQLPNKLPPAGYQGVEVLGENLAVFNTVNTGQQQPGGRFSTPIQRSFSTVGGNPFA